MGQYYKIILLAEDGKFIRFFINIKYGLKLMEHSYIDNPNIKIMEFLLSPEGSFYKSRIVWAGDYADGEDPISTNSKNLYHIAYDSNQAHKEFIPKQNIVSNYNYIINHSKKQFINKSKYILIHPLPLITAEGNGRGGGDYRGSNEEYVGYWARDVISFDNEVPSDYTEFEHVFVADC